MRIPLFILFGLFSLAGCHSNDIEDAGKRNENWAWFIDSRTGEGSWVPAGDSTTLNDGEYTLFFCNGKIRKKGKLKEGKDCDTIFQYDLEERLISKIIMLADSTLKEYMPDGKYKAYYPTCELRAEGEILKNKPVGTRTEYYRDGKTKSEKRWSPGNDTAYEINYFESGLVKDSAKLVNNVYDGVALEYYRNGKVERLRTYKNGKETGLYISYFENGQMDQKSHRFEGLADDTVTDWFENGRIKGLRYYVKGKKEGLYTAWRENGKVMVLCNFTKDIKDGSFKEFHESGQLAKEGNYNLGNKIGVWKYYDESGKVTETKQY